MGLIQYLFSNPPVFFLLVIPLVYSLTIHEVAHGWVAGRFGDDTAKLEGRLTLNPLSHLDPLGAVVLLLFGFGWAKPVPVNFYNLRPFKLGLVAVALAGCLANILFAALALFLLQIPVIAANRDLATILNVLAYINIILGAFNLIPIPPLDGSKILLVMLPAAGQRLFLRLEPFGFIILIVLLKLNILDPLINFVSGAIMLAIGLVIHFKS